MSYREYSDEQLNAFVDDEMAADERLELLQAAGTSDSLRQRLTELQLLKAQTRAAFPHPAAPTARRSSRWIAGLSRYLAAAVLGALTLGGVLSLGNSPTLLPETPLAGSSAAPQEVANTRHAQVVFHISSDRREDAEQLLDQVELVLQSHRERGQPLRVEVVANSLGLRLLQQGRSPFPQRIRQLHDTYPNLVFAACGNTLERLVKRYGEPIDILPQAVIIRSGVSSISRRQQTGWAYIKV